MNIIKWLLYGLFCSLINPSTTDDAFWYHLTLATCYQLVQFVLKIGSALAERVEGSALAERVGQGEVGGCTPLGESTWRLLQLAVENPDKRRVDHLSAFLHKQV